MPKKIQLNYYSMYLLHFLKEQGDPRKDDEEYVQYRGEDAAEEYEESLKGGYPNDIAQERAMTVLMRDFQDDAESPSDSESV